MTQIKRYLVLAVLLGLSGALAWSRYEVSGLTKDLRASGLRADSIAAAADTTRLHLLDSLKIYERRAIQVMIERDSVDVLLQTEIRARAALVAQVAALRDTLTGLVATDSLTDTRRAMFRLRSPPYTVVADVALPPPPAQGTADIQVDLDPITLDPAFRCGEPVAGIRPAVVSVGVPEWMTADVLEAQVDPSVCNPPPPPPPSIWEKVVGGAPYYLPAIAAAWIAGTIF